MARMSANRSLSVSVRAIHVEDFKHGIRGEAEYHVPAHPVDQHVWKADCRKTERVFRSSERE